MSKPNDLERELGELSARTAALSEQDELPRGKQPALFRAARAAAADALAAPLLAKVGEALGSRLADRPLLESTVELAREVAPVREALLKALEARAASPDAWAVERQAKLVGSLDRLLDLVFERSFDERAERELAPVLPAIVEARLATKAARRDRTSLEVTKGALRLLARVSPREPSLVSLCSRVVESEARRAGKDEPELALAALFALERGEPLARLRAARALEKRVDRKKIKERAGEVADGAIRELGVSPEETQELLADPCGLGKDGKLRLNVEGGELTLALDGRGRVVASPADLLAALPPDEKREHDAAATAIAKARSEHAQRLERALASGRAWRLATFRAIFLGENGLLADLAKRLVWLAIPASGSPISFRPSLEKLEDVFSGELPSLDESTSVRLAHPVELDQDELALWCERFREPELLVQPFPQLHRLVRNPPANALERFKGREAYREDLSELARSRGFRGLPLRGEGPWEIARDFAGRGAVLVVALEAVSAPAPPPKPRRDALRVFDDAERKQRAPREAAPRARIVSATLAGNADPAALAEAASDLHALTDELACSGEAFFLDWQRRKFKDPKAAWSEAQARLALGSEAAAAVRASLLPGTKIEGRWAILPGETFLELASGRVFQGPLRDFVPPWKVAERVKRAALSPDFPFERETDEETARVVEAALAFSQDEKKAGETGKIPEIERGPE